MAHANTIGSVFKYSIQSTTKINSMYKDEFIKKLII